MLIAQTLLNCHAVASQNKLLKTAQNAKHNSTLLHSQNFLSLAFIVTRNMITCANPSQKIQSSWRTATIWALASNLQLRLCKRRVNITVTS